MKQIFFLFIITSLLFLVACSGSETYRGKWKAIRADGAQIELTFQEDQMILKMSDTDSTTFDYSQIGFHIRGEISDYIIQLSDGHRYHVHFPVDNDQSKGLILNSFGEINYTIHRTRHMPLEELTPVEMDR